MNIFCLDNFGFEIYNILKTCIMKKYKILSLVLIAFVLSSCEELQDAIDCEQARQDTTDRINNGFDYQISRAQTNPTTDEEKAALINEINIARQQALDEANSEQCN